MTRQFARCSLLLVVALSTPVSETPGGVIPFRDEFDDPHDDGKPVLWRSGSRSTRVEDGSFIITGKGYTTSWVKGSEQTTDVSLRASVRFLEPSGLWVFGARARAEGSFYWGGIWSDGRAILGHTKRGNTTIQGETSTSYVPTTEDVSLRMDVYDTADGVELSLFAWGEGETMPDAPQLQVTDVTDTLTNGTVGMFINQGTPASVAVRYYEAVPEPTAFVLCLWALTFLGLFGFARRPWRRNH